MISTISSIFTTVLNMSFTASLVVFAVLIARLAIKKAPKKCSYFLWSVVALRLICPISIGSGFSIFGIGLIRKIRALFTMPEADSISTGTSIMEKMADEGLQAAIISENGQNLIGENPGLMQGSDMISPLSQPAASAITTADSINKAHVFSAQTAYNICCIIWLLGLTALIIYCAVKLIALCKKLSFATREEDNVYGLDGFPSPFIFGLVKPRIYLPYSYISGPHKDEKEMVLLHEKSHLKRGDHFIKVVAFALLCIHWFNPFIWLAFYLYNKDMEMSCDEMVLEKLNSSKEYSYALLKCANSGIFETPLPVAFAESSIKSRIKNAVNYKKKSRLVTVFTAIICLMIFTACASDPKADKAIVINSKTPVSTEETNPISEGVKVNEKGSEEVLMQTDYSSETDNSSETEDSSNAEDSSNTGASAKADNLPEANGLSEALQSRFSDLDGYHFSTEKSPKYMKPVAAFISNGYGIREILSDEENIPLFHSGMDFACPEGSEVLSLEAGSVFMAGKDDESGCMTVIIKQNDGYFVTFDHLSEILVKENDTVTKGQKIALSGATGDITGPCLHISVFKITVDEKGKENVVFVEPDIDDPDSAEPDTEDSDVSES